MPESAGELLTRMGTDGVIWAAEFVRLCPAGDALDATPGGTLHGWFCNAIEAGRSAGYAEGLRAPESTRALFVEIFGGETQ